MSEDTLSPLQRAYQRRNRDLDPQLVWRGKDEQDWSDLVVQAPPLFIQEKVHPKVLIDDLMRRTKESSGGADDDGQIDLFADFNGIPDDAKKTEFYQHDANWTNRMILGDSLQVMASLAEREGLRGKVQCIYIDPPYGIKFNSNFQWSTTNRDVKDGASDHITREPEQVKAFRDTWRDGIHSYLTYLRDRLSVAHELLTDDGSIFVQISDENVHRVRSLLDEVFGEENFCGQIAFTKATGLTSKLIASVFDHLLWYGRKSSSTKYRQIFEMRRLSDDVQGEFRWFQDEKRATTPISKVFSGLGDLPREGAGVFRTNSAVSPGVRANTTGSFVFQGRSFHSGSNRNWKTILDGMLRLAKADRLILDASPTRMYRQFWTDFNQTPLTNIWSDVRSEQDRVYVVQTAVTCRAAHISPLKPEEILLLELEKYRGGIALWGAVPSVYDTTDLPSERGVHVHARTDHGGPKVIDDTFRAVRLISPLVGQNGMLVEETEAIYFMVSSVFGQYMKRVSCTYCGESHLDKDWFSVHGHRRHLCAFCGRHFRDNSTAVGNTLHELQSVIGPREKVRKARTTLRIRQDDYPGGMRVWASNPAFLWTMKDQEEHGIHVHAFTSDLSKPDVDDTFSKVVIDGVSLDPLMVRMLMAQRALPHLVPRVFSISCPDCGHSHFSKGQLAFTPVREHRCTQCSREFSSRRRLRKTVANPLLNVLNKLAERAPRPARQEVIDLLTETL